MRFDFNGVRVNVRVQYRTDEYHLRMSAYKPFSELRKRLWVCIAAFSVVCVTRLNGKNDARQKRTRVHESLIRLLHAGVKVVDADTPATLARFNVRDRLNLVMEVDETVRFSADDRVPTSLRLHCSACNVVTSQSFEMACGECGYDAQL